MISINNKGVSLLEVSFYLIAFAVLVLFINNIFSRTNDFIRSDIITGQIKNITSGLDDYIRTVSSDNDFSYPHEVTPAYLISHKFISNSEDMASNIISHEDSYIFKLDSKSDSQQSVIAGITFLCLNDFAKEKYLVAHSLGYGGGIFSLNSHGESILSGAEGGWVLSNNDYSEIFNNPIIKDKKNCVFNLSSLNVAINNPGTLKKPEFSRSDFSIYGVSSGHIYEGDKISLDDGGYWEPLFKDDGIQIINRSEIKNAIIEVIDSGNTILMSKYITGEANYIYINGSYIDKDVFIRLIPLNDAGFKGKPLDIPSGGSIHISPFSHAFFSSAIFSVQEDIYNDDFSIPKKPLNNSRSDIGHCSDAKDKNKVPAGIDVVGVKLDLFKSNTGSDYLVNHNISLNIHGNVALKLDIKNPSDVSNKMVTWGTNDQRYWHPPLIPGIVTTGSGFYQITNDCKITDKVSIDASINIDGQPAGGNVSFSWAGANPVLPIPLTFNAPSRYQAFEQ